jgi:hypothetical protein
MPGPSSTNTPTEVGRLAGACRRGEERRAHAVARQEGLSSDDPTTDCTGDVTAGLQSSQQHSFQQWQAVQRHNGQVL